MRLRCNAEEASLRERRLQIVQGVTDAYIDRPATIVKP
jgi:hypothetical protein